MTTGALPRKHEFDAARFVIMVMVTDGTVPYQLLEDFDMAFKRHYQAYLEGRT